MLPRIRFPKYIICRFLRHFSSCGTRSHLARFLIKKYARASSVLPKIPYTRGVIYAREPRRAKEFGLSSNTLLTRSASPFLYPPVDGPVAATGRNEARFHLGTSGSIHRHRHHARPPRYRTSIMGKMGRIGAHVSQIGDDTGEVGGSWFVPYHSTGPLISPRRKMV
jgi:hypothetical protein